MSDHQAIVIAKAVTTELNSSSAGWTTTWNAKRMYRPIHNLEDLGVRHVTVVPNLIEDELASRNISKADTKIGVGVQQRLAAKESDNDATNAELDGLMANVQEIADHFLGKPLAGTNATCVGIDNTPIFHPEHLEKDRLFTSAVTLHFREGRGR